MITPFAFLPLQAALALPLLGGSPAPLAHQGQSLLAALPEDTFLVARLPDPKALLAQRETSSWVAFAMDSQWDVFLPELLLGMEEPEWAAAAPAWRGRILGALGDANEVVGFASGPVEQGLEPTLGLFVRGGAESTALLKELVGPGAQSVEMEGGHKVLITEGESSEEEEGRAELFYEKDGLVLFVSSESVDRSRGVAMGCLGALAAGGAPVGPYAIPGLAKMRRPGAAMEIALDMGPIWRAAADEFLPDGDQSEPGVFAIGGGDDSESWDKVVAELFDAGSSMEWLYADWEVGLGETLSAHVSMPYAEDSILGELFSFLGAADPSLFSQVPATAISATIANIDLLGMTKWGLGLVKGYSEEAYGQAQGALAGGQAALGLDIVEDLIGNMTGEFIGFSSVPSFELGDEKTELAGERPTTVVASLKDSEPLLELVEGVLPLTGLDAAFSSETVELGEGGAEMELWKAAESLGLPVVIGVGHKRMLFSLDPVGGEAYLGLLRGASDGGSITDDKAQREAMQSASGAVITWQPTASGADIMESLGAMAGDMMEEEIELLEFESEEDFTEEELAELQQEIRALSVHFEESLDGMAALWREYFDGSSMTELQFNGGMMSIKTETR